MLAEYVSALKSVPLYNQKDLLNAPFSDRKSLRHQHNRQTSLQAASATAHLRRKRTGPNDRSLLDAVTATNMTIDAPALMRKLSQKIDQHRAVQLSPAELDLLVVCGAFQAICQAATDFQRDRCRERSAQSRSMPVDHSHSVEGTVVPISRLSGTTKPEDVSVALARAQAMTGRGGLPLTVTI